MVKLIKSNAFATPKPHAETRMDKTTRAVREILDGEAENREIKTARLRKARLEREANSHSEAIAPTISGARKSHAAELSHDTGAFLKSDTSIAETDKP